LLMQQYPYSLKYEIVQSINPKDKQPVDVLMRSVVYEKCDWTVIKDKVLEAWRYPVPEIDIVKREPKEAATNGEVAEDEDEAPDGN
ncbi:MAG: hypothetical protein ACYCPT_13175, partial [Acidimicrobiales bacterium]